MRAELKVVKMHKFLADGQLTASKWRAQAGAAGTGKDQRVLEDEEYQCLDCQHKWRAQPKPRQCAKCRSPYWEGPVI